MLMSGQLLFERIREDLRQIVIKDLQESKEVDNLYKKGEFRLLQLTKELPSEESIDFDYYMLSIKRQGEYIDSGEGHHEYRGLQWEAPFRLVRNGFQTCMNQPGKEIGGIVRKLSVEVRFEELTGEAITKLISIEQDVYVHR